MGINVTPDESEKWSKYFGETFPTANGDFIEKMVRRMIRTLSFCGLSRRMSGEQYQERLRAFKKSLDSIPPDPRNKLMGG